MKRKNLIFTVIFIVFVLFFEIVRPKPELYSRPGMDTRLFICDGMYQVYKNAGNRGDSFCYTNRKKIEKSLLEDVYAFDLDFRKAYIVSREGYAVIDGKTGKCRLLLKCDVEYWKKGRIILEDGSERSVAGEECLGDDVQLVNSFNDYSEKEQKKLLELSDERKNNK